MIHSPYGNRLTDSEKQACLEIIKQEENPDITTLSRCLVFSTSYCDIFDALAKLHFYNLLRKEQFDTNGHEYFEGIDLVCDDFENVIDYFIRKPTLFILDPPYLYTDKKMYSAKYWTLDKYILL